MMKKEENSRLLTLLFLFFILVRKNIILTEVLEERTINPIEYGSSTANNSFPVQRELAQAMIPGKHLVKAEIEKDVYDKLLK